MKICVNAHEKIVYIGNNCPVCERDKEIYKLKEIIGALKSSLEFLTHLCQNLQEKTGAKQQDKGWVSLSPVV